MAQQYRTCRSSLHPPTLAEQGSREPGAGSRGRMQGQGGVGGLTWRRRRPCARAPSPPPPPALPRTPRPPQSPTPSPDNPHPVPRHALPQDPRLQSAR
eukprot:2770024-Rhodomonas_salina.2